MRSFDETRDLLEQAVRKAHDASGGDDATVDGMEAAIASRYGLDPAALAAASLEIAADVAGPLPYPAGREAIRAKATDLLMGFNVGLELSRLLDTEIDLGALTDERLTTLKLDIERELSMRST